MVKQISILGSTGSVGRQTLDVIKDFPEKFRVLALTGNKNGPSCPTGEKLPAELAVSPIQGRQGFPAPGGTEDQGVGEEEGCWLRQLIRERIYYNGGGGFCRFKTYPGGVMPG